MNFLAHVVTRYRILASALVIVGSGLAAVGTARLGLDDSYEDVFRSQDARYQQFMRLARTFGTGENDCVVLLESADILTRPALAAILEIHNRAGELAEVESVVSLYTARRPRRVGRLFLPLFPTDKGTDEQFERARVEADSHPLVKDVLLSADHRASLVLVRLTRAVKTVDDVEPVLLRLREIVQTATAGKSMSGQLTGVPAIRVETIRRIQREHVLISSAGAALATIVAWFILRRLAAVFVVVLPSLVGVLWTLGALGLAGQNLTAINIVLPALVMVIGTTDSIHLMFHFREGRALGLSPVDAAKAAVRDIGGACLLTALTTSIGFFSLVVADDVIIRDFGLFGGIGVLLTFFVVITLLPVLCSTPLGRACSPRQAHAAETHPTWPDRLLDLIAPRASWFIAGGLAAGVVLIAVASRIHAEYSFMENLTSASESYRAMRMTEEKFGGGPLLQVLVEWPEQEELSSRRTIDVLAAVHRAIDDNPISSAPVSLYSLLQNLPGEGDPFERIGELRYIQRDRLRSIVYEEERMALVTAYVPDAGATALGQPLEALSGALREIERENPGYQLHLTGFAIMAAYRTTPMIMNMLTGIVLELFIIVGIISLVLRSFWLGLLSLPSNIFPMVATAAGLVMVGMPLRYASVLAFNICLGIAVDDTVHFLSRYQRELSASGDREAAIRSSYRAVGPVMVTQTILMLCGFGAGLFCTIPTIRAFSGCACVALLLALLSESLILPPLLFCLAWFPGKRATSQAMNLDVGNQTTVMENSAI